MAARAPGLAACGFIAGLIATLPMAATMFLASSAIGLPTLPDLLADPAVFLIPGPLFGLLIDALGYTAKSLLLAGMLEAQLIVGGLVGRYWATRYGGGVPRRQWLGALGIVLAIYLVVEIVLMTVLGYGTFGVGLPPGPLVGGLGLLLVHLAYAVPLVLVFRSLPGASAGGDAPPDRSRRRVLVALGSTSLTLIGGGTAWRALLGAPVVGASAGAPAGEMSPAVTPTDVFYTVSKNFVDPRVDGAAWRLAIGGLVEMPRVLTFDELRGLATGDQYFTLACISNVVGGDLIGNAHWRGVRLRDLLASAGIKPGVRKVAFHAADGYTDSIAFSTAMDDATMVAVEMNGAPLTDKHGYPARLLIPGIFGMKNVKWVTRIELLGTDFRGYWQERGWSDPAPVQTFSRIDVPLGGRTVTSPLDIGGIAHAGDRGIKRVELSVDGGRTWLEARLVPPLSANSWTLWSLRWAAPRGGQFVLKVRATDGLDRVQVAEARQSFPDGATGWHTATIRVV